MSRPHRRVAARWALCALILLTALAFPRVTRAADTATTTDRLNLRNGPGLTYDVLAVIPAGVTVTLGGDPSEGWYPVAYQDAAGWAYGAYLALGGQAASATRGGATVVTAWLNLRGGPGLDYPSVAMLPYGTVVQLLDGPQATDGYSWFHVDAAGYGIGFVAGAYLDAGVAGLGGPAAESAAVPAPSPSPSPSPSPTPAPQPRSSGNSVVDIITQAALRYGQSPEAMLAVARCESNLNPTDVNPYSGASGLFQFLPGTWATTPYADYSILDAWANANAAAWMWSVGRRGEWVC